MLLPLAGQAAQALQPLAQNATRALQPLADSAGRTLPPLAGNAVRTLQPLADQAARTLQPLASQVIGAVLPAADHAARRLHPLAWQAGYRLQALQRSAAYRLRRRRERDYWAAATLSGTRVDAARRAGEPAADASPDEGVRRLQDGWPTRSTRRAPSMAAPRTRSWMDWRPPWRPGHGWTSTSSSCAACMPCATRSRPGPRPDRTSPLRSGPRSPPERTATWPTSAC